MKITDLHIENFRCFGEAHLRIAPITLVTGANSAGKTSLFAPILAAAQTDGSPVMLSPNGRYIDMGDYLAMVHRHRPDSIMSVAFSGESGLGGPTTIASQFSYDEASRTPRLLALSVAGGYYDLSVRHNGEGYDLSYEVTPGRSKTLLRMLRNPVSRGFYDAVNEVLASAVRDAAENDYPRIPNPARLLERTQNGETFSGTISFAQPRDFFATLHRDDILVGLRVAPQLSAAITSFQKRLGHVSSFRHAPERTYYEVSRADLRVGRYGEHYVEQVSQWDSTRDSAIDRLQMDLAALGILSTLRIHRMEGGRLELMGKPKDSSSLTNLADLGFGTSQVLPVLVAINQLPSGSLFTVSQPETHLHPETQARLADYLVRVASQRNIRFIVETHSEYLINRLRLLVAKGSVAEDDVSVVYVTNDGEEATVCPIVLRADGRIVGAPNDFFKTYMMDVMKLALGTDE